MLKNLILCLKLAIVFCAIVFFAKALQYLIFNGGFSGSFMTICSSENEAKTA